MAEKQTRFEEGTPSPKPTPHKKDKAKPLKTEDDIRRYEKKLKRRRPITNLPRNHYEMVSVLKQIERMKKLGIKSQQKD
jgi:hypothetical protein